MMLLMLWLLRFVIFLTTEKFAQRKVTIVGRILSPKIPAESKSQKALDFSLMLIIYNYEIIGDF